MALHRLGPGGRDRRQDNGWSLWKEIVGTVIAMLPYALAALAWGVSVERVQARHDAEIQGLKEARTEIKQALQRIEDEQKSQRTLILELRK